MVWSGAYHLQMHRWASAACMVAGRALDLETLNKFSYPNRDRLGKESPFFHNEVTFCNHEMKPRHSGDGIFGAEESVTSYDEEEDDDENMGWYINPEYCFPSPDLTVWHFFGQGDGAG